ncbi:hypothetical protein L9F63_002734 [Diploptera punctata]|uniref:Zinc-finger domain-containing protein n=1 Tax=Diploptera punctata TaxID=6984 RepID=A0AAD7ZRD9_DIPPU|nr:hypothetical protein L9F63_002734 [Diploptera punctata]
MAEKSDLENERKKYKGRGFLKELSALRESRKSIPPSSKSLSKTKNPLQEIRRSKKVKERSSRMINISDKVKKNLFREDILKNPQRRISKQVAQKSMIVSPDEITEEHLINVAQKITEKTYSMKHGTTCHQCRQKTMDTKTICRSGKCIGLRGQFCGPCLKNRYGENAEGALKNPHWACPPCRDLCNCSICRTRVGKQPTGILVPLVKKEGYSSVKDYLQYCGE